MKVSRFKPLKLAIVLEKDNFSRLINAFESICPRLSIEATCRDGLDREFETLDQLYSYANQKSQSIVSLIVRGWSLERDSSFTIKIIDRKFENISLSYACEEQQAHQLSEAFDVFIDDSRPMWSWFAARGWGGLAWCAVMLWLYWPLIIAFVTPGESISLNTSKPINWINLAFGIAFAAAMYAMMEITAKVTREWFPMATFCIGNGIKRHRNNGFVRSTVILTLILGLVSSALYPLITTGRL